MPEEAGIRQLGFQANGGPLQGHRRASRSPGALGSPFVQLLAYLAAALGPGVQA